mgnify:CR=1 FL=1
MSSVIDPMLEGGMSGADGVIVGSVLVQAREEGRLEEVIKQLT